MTPEFNAWWDSDKPVPDDNYRKDSPAYWAWAGWQMGAAQREKELMVVGMEPKQYIGVDDEPDFTYYTATQLAAARLQGAEDERKTYASEANQLALQSLYEFQEATRCDTAAQFVQGERVNQGLLDALKGILAGATSWQLREHDQCVIDARAAIAAAEKEATWHQDGTTDSAKTMTDASVRGSQTGLAQRGNCERCGAELRSDMTTTCYQCNQD